MIARYIDADFLLKELDLRETDTAVQLKQGDEKHRLCQKGILSGLNWSRNIIYELPAADVVEVKHGYWIEHSPDVAAMRAFHKLGIGKGMSEKSIFWTCSCCDSWGTLTQNFCSNCGAKMDVK